MVKIQVKTLSELSLEVTSAKAREFVFQHCKSCTKCIKYDTNGCSDFQAVKKLYLLPHGLRQSIHNKVYNFLKGVGAADYNALNHVTEIFYFHGLQISEYTFSQQSSNFMRDLKFLMTYGEKVTFLELKRHDLIDRNSARLHLLCFSHVVILDLDRMQLTENFLQVLGKECKVIKEIRKVHLYETITAKSFEKFCFYDYPTNQVKNNCCGTLELLEVYFNYPFSDKYDSSTIEVLNILFLNLSNLKNLGNFTADFYLNSLKSKSNLKPTNLEYANINNLSKDVVPLLKLLCPKLKQLHTNVVEPGIAVCLRTNQFSNQLEILYNCNSIDTDTSFHYNELISVQWSALKDLLQVQFTDVMNLSVLARQLPCLKRLWVLEGIGVTWNGKDHFNAMEKVMLPASPHRDLNWFASFAKTVKIIEIHSDDDDDDTPFNKDTCKILRSIPFPCLEKVEIGPLVYDFEFVSNVIMCCSNLKSFTFVDPVLTRVQRIQLKKFLKENNLECDFRPPDLW